MSRMSVFITGGAGFIGRWLVARCLEEGLRVAVYDNLSTGSVKNIEPFLEQIDFFEDDILEFQTLIAAFQKTAPDILFHLAALHYVPYCTDHPDETMRVNVAGTYSVLKAAVEGGLEQAIIASSGAIYPSREGPLSENEIPEVNDVYGLSKLLAEQIGHNFAATGRLSCLVARLFNVYGPFETNPHLIPHIIEELHRGGRVGLGNLDTKRDYIYVEDAVNLLLEYSKIRAPAYAVINIGTGSEYSAREIVAEISSLIGQRIEVTVTPEQVRSKDKLHQTASIEKLIRVVHSEPRLDLREGLEKLLIHEGLIEGTHVPAVTERSCAMVKGMEDILVRTA